MRKLILVSLLLAVAVASTACLARFFPGDSSQREQTQPDPTATPQQVVKVQPTNTPQPPTLAPTSSPEPTPEPAIATADEDTSDEVTPSEEMSGEAALFEDVADIVDVIWQWIEVYEADTRSVIADPQNYVLVFYADGKFNVRADCNTGHGTYTLEEEDRLALGPIALTKMLCPKGSRSHQYVEMLGQLDSVSVDSQTGNLILNFEDDAGMMVFAEAGRPKVPPGCDPKVPPGCTPKIPPACERECPSMDGIVRVVWQWVEIHDPGGQTDVPDPENYLLTLHPDGTFNIKADCNVGSGTYTLEGDHLSLDITAITEAYCGDESLFDLFITMLDAVDTVELEQSSLVLTLPDGASKMVFCPVGKAKVPPDPCDWIVDISWNWERFDGPTDEDDIVVDDPGMYTLQLLPDDTLSFQADCNIGSGTYTCCCDGTLSLELGPTTLADCGPNSLYDEYLDKLGDVASFAMDEGKLILNLEADAGNMVFGPGNQAANGLEIDLDAITLDTTGLSESWQANLVPATPLSTGPSGIAVGLPEHIEISFGEAADAPVLYIIPVEAYKQLWEAEGEPMVSVLVQALQEILQAPPETFPTAGVPVLPFEELDGTNDFAVHGEYVSTEILTGLRFVGRFVQGPTVVTNEGLRYIFQGFAGDSDEYLVAFFYPVTTTALPDSPEGMAAERGRLLDDDEAYFEERTTALNRLTEGEWDPDLSILDAVIASLRF